MNSEGDPFDALLGEHFEAEEPYAFFRARVRERMAGEGWLLRVVDEEADFFSRGRWWIYASPSDCILEFHSVVVFEFLTVEDAESSCDEGGVEPAHVSYEFNAEDALRYVRAREGVTGSESREGREPDHGSHRC
jgi:hypothetical protein